MTFLRQLGYLVWLAMLAMSLVFYRERAFFMDAGFQLFNLVNEGRIQVYHYRFVTAVPQVLPWVLMKMGAPLWALGMAFSASYILFFGLVYHLLVRWLHNERLGWALIFLFTLTSLDSFYHIQSEFYLGLALLLLAFGIVLRFAEMGAQGRLAQLWPLVLLLPTVAFSHKLSLIFFVFLWLFFFLGKKDLRRWWYWAFLGLFLLAAGVKSIWFTNWYEAAKQAEFRGNWAQYFPNFHTIPANLVFLERCLAHYYFLPGLLLVVSVFYLLSAKNRGINLLKLGLVWSFAAGYALLYSISDPVAQFRFYSEVSYLPLILFAAVPFLCDVVPAPNPQLTTHDSRLTTQNSRLTTHDSKLTTQNSRLTTHDSKLTTQNSRLTTHDSRLINWLPLAFAAVVALRLATIALNHETFTRKFDWIERKLAEGRQAGSNRFLLKKENAPMDTLLMEWGVPFTAMHLSALRDPAAASTILVLPDFSWYQDKLARTDIFLSPFNKFLEKKQLNRRYYDLRDGKYLMLEK